jgi:hypothetical protein
MVIGRKTDWPARLSLDEFSPPDRQSAGVVSGEADAFPTDSPNGRRSRNIKNLKPSLTRAFRKNLGTRRIKKSALVVVKDEEEYRFDI